MSCALLGPLLAAPALAQSKAKARAQAKVSVDVQLELALVLKKHGFPLPKDSLLGDASTFKKSFAQLGERSAKKAASVYRWGLLFTSTHRGTSRQILVSVFATSSTTSSIVLADLMLLKEQGMDKAIGGGGGTLHSKKYSDVNPKGSSGGYAYERVAQLKADGPTLSLDKVVVSSGIYTIEVALVAPKSKKNVKLLKRLTSAAMRGIGAPGAQPRPSSAAKDKGKGPRKR